MIIVHDASGRIVNVVSEYPRERKKEMIAANRALGYEAFEHAGDIAPTTAAGMHVVHVLMPALAHRPACPATVAVDGRRIAISGAPPGSAVTASLEGVTITVDDAEIEVDEAGPLTITITPPWPYLEAVHDLVIE